MISHHVSTFAGFPVVTWEPDIHKKHDPAKTIFAIRIDWDNYPETTLWTEKFSQFLKMPGIDKTPGLVIGVWSYESGDADDVVEAVVAARDKLPNLQAIFMGDITYEESEISWIEQSNLAPLLNAYPQLAHLRVRGGNRLSFGKIKHDRLKSFIIETGGLNRQVVREIGNAELPALEHLEIWLGTTNYGADTTVDDLQAFYECSNFPQLRTLALRNSDITDDIAIMLSGAPVIERIDALDLSMGTIGDDGALALIKSAHIHTLKKLDISHHYCSPEMIIRLKELSEHGVTVIANDSLWGEEGTTNRDWRFTAVSE